MKRRNLYENVIILKGTLKEKEYKEALNKIIEEIKNFIHIENIEEIGLKKLAYEVRNNKMGYFVIIDLKANKQEILDMERVYRINDDVLKFITVRKDD